MAVELTEYRLRRQLRSASAVSPTPGPCKRAPRDASVVLTWRKVSPSAHLMVDPRNDARAVIRDTGANAGRFLWSVLAAGEMDSMSEGHSDHLAQAQSIGGLAAPLSARQHGAVPLLLGVVWPCAQSLRDD